MTKPYSKTPEITNDFAAQTARAAFGKYYVRPLDRDFQDHGPRWQKPGDVSTRIVEGLGKGHSARHRERRDRPRVKAPA